MTFWPSTQNAATLPQQARAKFSRVQSPDGNVFEFTYQQFSRIGDVGVNGRLAGVAQDQVTATLSSDVMEQRPMAIHRSIRQPSDELPEPLELKAQIEGTYSRTRLT